MGKAGQIYRLLILFVYLIILLPAVLFAQGLPFEPNDPYFSYNATEKPGFPGQWHLINSAPSAGISFTVPDDSGRIILMKNSGVDANLRDAWKLGYTGKGVTIGIVDDGVQGDHPDMKDNYKADLSRNFSSNPDIANRAQGPIDNDDNHGTAVAGVAGARGGNGIGVTGAAPYASIVGLNPYPGYETSKAAIRALYVDAYYWKSGVNSSTGKTTSKSQIPIMNHSYGQNKPWGQGAEELHGADITKALNLTAGNNVIHVWAAGNERNKGNEDTGKDDVLTNSNVIPVAALGSDGKFADYSNYGSNVFVAAPSNRSDLTGLGITTIDRTGANLGYNRYSTANLKGDWTDLYADYDYASMFGGTSSAAPLVSGIMALGKEANSNLDVRMAKHVLARTSTRIDPDDASTTGGWLKNGAGYWFNPNYGFGNINAGKFVETVKKVAYVTDQTNYTTGTVTVNETIKSVGSGGTNKQIVFTEAELTAYKQPLEGVEVNLNFTHSNRGNLTASLTSPSTMKSRLFNSTALLATDQKDNVSVTNFGWTFLSNAFWGENPVGTWNLTMGDAVNNGVGTWNSYKLTLLMGDLVFNSTGTTTQTKDIKARSLLIKNADEIFVNPTGLTVEVSEKAQVSSGELNINGMMKMNREADDEDPEDGFFVLDGGILSGAGTIDAPYGFYHTDGTIKPGNSIGALTINGDYIQGTQGKLLIEVASTTSNDLLAINGAADLSGILQTSWTGGYTPAIKTKFGTILTASSGVTGQFSSLLTNITPTVLFKPKYDIPNRIYLMVERDYTNQTLLPYLSSNQKAVASMLNSVGNTAAGDLDTVLTALDAIPAYGQTAYAFDQLAPRGSEAFSGMGISAAAFQTGNLSERLSDLRRGINGLSFTGLYYKNSDFIKNGKEPPIMLASAGSDFTGMLPSGVNEKWGLFVKGNAVSGDQRDTPDRTGYDFTSAGVTMGSDYRFTKNFIAGLMLGINTARANVDNMGSKVKMDGYTLGTYGTYYKDGFYIDGSMSYGLTDYDNTRRIVFPGLDRTATSSPDGNQFNAYGGTGYDFRKNNWIVTPTMSLQYVKLNINSYTESGAGAINLDVDRQGNESLQGNIGGRLSYIWRTDKVLIMPAVRVSYGYEFLRDSQNIASRLAQGGSPFSIETMSPDRNSLNLGAGITAFTARDMSVYINYDAQIGENKYVAHSVNAGLRVGF